MIGFLQLKKNKININISIKDWFIQIRQKYPRQSQETINSIWVLLSHVLNKNKSWLAANPDHLLEPDQLIKLDKLLSNLMDGIPLAYLINHWSFFGYDFYINQTVLIPRPETELLVEKAITWLKQKPSARSMVEVGIGSGCISITLANIFPDLNITASDISFNALLVSQKNISCFSLSNIFLFQGDLFGGLKKKFDLICANLPYIPTELLRTLPVCKYEPDIALDGGSNGLVYMTRMLKESKTFLNRNGLILMEIESTKKEEIEKISNQLFPDASIKVLDDFADKPRLLTIQSR